MKKLMFLFVCMFFAASATVSAKKAEEAPFESRGNGPRFFLDYAQFMDEGGTYVEFYLQVSYGDLQFIRYKKNKKRRFYAKYSFYFEITSADKDSVFYKKAFVDSFFVETYEETERMTQARITLFSFTIPPGTYKIHAELKDAETKHVSFITNKYIAVRDFSTSNFVVSDLQLSRSITKGVEGKPFVKNGLYIQPNATRIFSTQDELNAYFEAYNFSLSDPSPFITVSISLLNQRKKEIITSAFRTKKPKGTLIARIFKIRLSKIKDLKPGTYQIVLKLTDNITGSTSESVKSFKIIKNNK